MAAGIRVRRIMVTAVATTLVSIGMMSAEASEPSHPYPWGQPGCPCPEVLHQGSPTQAGFVPGALGEIDGTIDKILGRRAAPGAVVLVARRGVIAKWQAYGDA